MVAPALPGLVPVDGAALAAFCRRHRVRTVRVFGSAVRGELTPESDLDLLVEFEPGVDPDLLELGGMQQELSELFSREVDLKVSEMFSPENLRRIMSSSVIGYAA
ncbi:MAG TPA: nucleotidyltransferase domain-containing protein [Phycisphaerales bacterium]|nr:nucleotidyltransferase domain-containing protein [Phycisphaerales bacterium]